MGHPEADYGRSNSMDLMFWHSHLRRGYRAEHTYYSVVNMAPPLLGNGHLPQGLSMPHSQCTGHTAGSFQNAVL